MRQFSGPTMSADPRAVSPPPPIATTLSIFDQARALAQWINTLPGVHNSRAWRRQQPPHEVRCYAAPFPGPYWNRVDPSPSAALPGGILYVAFEPRMAFVYRPLAGFEEFETTTLRPTLNAIRAWVTARGGIEIVSPPLPAVHQQGRRP
ncbi:hypothetical protein GCM10011504_57520 [Siccirubricoccus deserti]|nr:hypothetical protein GCM10011504_57520 [Siccirubricoccus deserti]